jgi:hypothetical protein
MSTHTKNNNASTSKKANGKKAAKTPSNMQQFQPSNTKITFVNPKELSLTTSSLLQNPKSSQTPFKSKPQLPVPTKASSSMVDKQNPPLTPDTYIYSDGTITVTVHASSERDNIPNKIQVVKYSENWTTLLDSARYFEVSVYTAGEKDRFNNIFQATCQQVEKDIRRSKSAILYGFMEEEDYIGMLGTLLALAITMRSTIKLYILHVCPNVAPVQVGMVTVLSVSPSNQGLESRHIHVKRTSNLETLLVYYSPMEKGKKYIPI